MLESSIIKTNSTFKRPSIVPNNNENYAQTHLFIKNVILQNRLDDYFRINLLNDNFDLITKQFEDSIYDSLLNSENCMIPFFDVTLNNNAITADSLITVIDIGGSTLRISVVRFLENNNAECIINRTWLINDSNKHFDRSFFDWIANNFKSIINNELLEKMSNSHHESKINIGITWSFPLVQNIAPNRGIVSDLGKGFSVSDEFKGKDLKDIFETCFKQNDILIDVRAIVNDSISVYIAGSYFKDSKLGLVQGTGVNSCFLINSNMLGDFKKQSFENDRIISKYLVNTEASFLGFHLVDYITSIDLKLNNTWNSVIQKKYLPPHLTTKMYGVFQPLELLTSGRYLPEIIRRIIIENTFSTNFDPNMLTNDEQLPYGLSATRLSKIYKNTNDSEDLNNLRIITDTIIYRASLILASYIIALLKVTKFTKIATLDVCVVGSMLEFFPGYKDKVLDILQIQSRRQHIPSVSFDFIKDSSVYGAAIASFVDLNC